MRTLATLTFSFLLAFLCSNLTIAQDQDYLGDPPPGATPLEISMGFSLASLSDVNEREETIEFDGTLYLRWKDPRLAHDPLSVGYTEDYVLGDYSQAPRLIYQGDFSVKEIFDGWRPHIIMMNGISDRIKTNVTIAIWPDGIVTYAEIFNAKVETPMDLRLFPFDKQELKIYFHPFVYDREMLILVPDDMLGGIWDQDMGIAEWTSQNVSVNENPRDLIRFNGNIRTVSEYVVSIGLERRPLHMIISIIFPLVLLVSLSWCVFWLDEESVTNRVNISFIGILSVVAYYLVIQNSIPKINYLTLIDAFILLTFIILAASVVVSIVVDKLNRAGRKEAGNKVDRIARWAFPGVYIAISGLLGVIFFLLSRG